MKKYVHINYYYDTPELYFYKNNITVRIRQNGNSFEGTVKKHIFNGIHSESDEYDFPVQRLPGSVYLQGKKLCFKGQMITKRKVYFLTEGILLCIDKNIYLGKTDYEMELEYTSEMAQEAERIKNTADTWLKNFSGQLREENLYSKSTRFFETARSMEERYVWC